MEVIEKISHKELNNCICIRFSSACDISSIQRLFAHKCSYVCHSFCYAVQKIVCRNVMCKVNKLQIHLVK